MSSSCSNEYSYLTEEIVDTDLQGSVTVQLRVMGPSLAHELELGEI
jgi:hypothetical protein